jgi:L-glyceraldehyde 3-phosphate reductase
VASAVLAGGALTGKYGPDDAGGRLSSERDNPRWQRAFVVGERLRALADTMGTTPSRLAIAFCLANPRVASVLFGATTPDQVADNVGALELSSELGDEEMSGLREVGFSETPT